MVAQPWWCKKQSQACSAAEMCPLCRQMPGQHRRSHALSSQLWSPRALMMTWPPLQLPLTKQPRRECWVTACCLWMLSGSLGRKPCLQRQVLSLAGPLMSMLPHHNTEAGRC